MLGDPISGGKLLEQGVFHAAVLVSRDNTTQVLSEAFSGVGPDDLEKVGKDIVLHEVLKNPGLVRGVLRGRTHLMVVVSGGQQDPSLHGHRAVGLRALVYIG